MASTVFFACVCPAFSESLVGRESAPFLRNPTAARLIEVSRACIMFFFFFLQRSDCVFYTVILLSFPSSFFFFCVYCTLPFFSDCYSSSRILSKRGEKGGKKKTQRRKWISLLFFTLLRFSISSPCSFSLPLFFFFIFSKSAFFNLIKERKQQKKRSDVLQRVALNRFYTIVHPSPFSNSFKCCTVLRKEGEAPTT